MSGFIWRCFSSVIVVQGISDDASVGWVAMFAPAPFGGDTTWQLSFAIIPTTLDVNNQDISAHEKDPQWKQQYDPGKIGNGQK